MTWLRDHRTSLVIGGALVVAIAVAVLLGGGARTSADLDPANPDPDGAQALARVLADQGVEVEVVRDAAALERLDGLAGSTVVVTSAGDLGRSTARRLVATAQGARIVVVDPAPGTLRALGIRVSSTRSRPAEDLAADCADPLTRDLHLDVDRATTYALDGCFSDETGSMLVQRAGLLLFGAGGAWANGQVLRGDNAALALRLLGQRERLVWYVPSLADLVADDGVSLSTLLPRWLAPGLFLAVLASGALVLWRARRLGPLASEPLPVVVRAIETTRSRGRLYRRAGDRAHAASALRTAARRRAAERLRLGVGSEPDVVVREVARHLDRPVAEIQPLLDPATPAPVTDHDLIHLANALAELDREVRRP
ncbi:MAG: DUF4350 domain-containing protein [Actinobacteria bacterium]|uniref:Unannotated protein n=1 Tax=freshwater metagenome TaxID=449393 RepID=A0A6J6Q371_9ZZZZ|nr:DUF4350 domain-containing protein [Actinomycetota bacterium]